MKPTDVKSGTQFNCEIGNNDKVPKFKVYDHVRISKYKNILQNVTLQICQKKFLLLKS